MGKPPITKRERCMNHLPLKLVLQYRLDADRKQQEDLASNTHFLKYQEFHNGQVDAKSVQII